MNFNLYIFFYAVFAQGNAGREDFKTHQSDNVSVCSSTRASFVPRTSPLYSSPRIRRMVIPLMDLSILLLEQYQVRKKRSFSMGQTTKGSYGFLNKMLQGKQESKEGADAFVDSLVEMMSKSDPALLWRLRERIKEFEEKAPLSNVIRKVDKRPMIQFFNVTRITLGSPSGDGSGKKTDLICEEDESTDDVHTLELEDQIPQSQSHKKEVLTCLRTRDGRVARIERSNDKRSYKLEIEDTTHYSEDNFWVKELLRYKEHSQRKREKSPDNDQQNINIEYPICFWQGVIGKAFDNSNVGHSFEQKPKKKLSLLSS